MNNTIILTVHNKELTIRKILNNLFKTISSSTQKIIIILDGCNDKTNSYVKKYIASYKPKIDIQILITPNIWETKANNVGLRLVETQFATIVQDDMLMMQKNWDRTLLNNFKKYKLFAVSGRAAHNFSLKNKRFEVVNLFGREYPFSSNSIFGKIIGKFMISFKAYWLYKYFRFFSIRLVVNRGPLVLDMSKLKELNFLDEIFAPFELDDVDLCCRAFKKFGLHSAANPIYYKEINGSKKTNYNSLIESQKSIIKNSKIIFDRHNDLAI